MKSPKAEKAKKAQMYARVIEKIFFDHYKVGIRHFEFDRAELIAAAVTLKVDPAKNPGDLIYSFRSRREFPESILKTCQAGETWTIESAGIARYRFRLSGEKKWLTPRTDIVQRKVPDATPELIERYALTDEQAALAKVRYNRLIDLFTGTVAYSLQNHVKTQVGGIGQIEVDELYLAVNRKGEQFTIPVEAKGGSDKLGVHQIKNNVAYCKLKFPDLQCRPVAVQSMSEGVIALLELVVTDGKVAVAEEKQYRLVPASQISAQDLKQMAEGPES